MFNLTPYEFDADRDLKSYPAWFLDGVHSVPPWTPMYGALFVEHCRHGMQWAAEKLSIPTSKGWDWRLFNGGGYLIPIPVSSPEEVKRREVVFKEKITPFIQNYDSVWQEVADEMENRLRTLKGFEAEKASNVELLDHLEETLQLKKRFWELHFYMMYGVFAIYRLFENICNDLFGIDDSHLEFQRLVRGFDNKLFEVDKSLWELAEKVTELDLTGAFDNNNTEQILIALEKNEAGKGWLREFRVFLQEHGWRTQRMTELNVPSWIEDPSPALSNIKQYMAVGGEFSLEEERARLVKEREQAQREIISKVPEEQREWFTTLMSAAQKASSFSEGHNYYMDLPTHVVIRKAFLAAGARLVAAGTIDGSEDIWFLIPDEVKRCIIAPERHDLRQLVTERKGQWESWNKEGNPPIITNVSQEEAMGFLMQSSDPIVLGVSVGKFPVPKPELKADLYGVPGAAGIAEGTARVIVKDEELGMIKQGEILVAPSTYSSWTPVFPLITGAVIDRGGSLSHAVIVGREYGIPVVTNTFEGTQKIRTGDRIRIDGTLGAVYILQKSG